MMLKTGANKVDSGADGLYSDDMGRQKTKADQLGDFLDDLTVEELDEQLVRLGRRWMMVYTNRQLLAKEQGFTAPPPDPPRIDSAGPSLAAQASVETLGWLIEQYLQHDKFKSLQFSTRRNYGNNFARINKEAGSIKLSDLDLEILARLHAGWVGANNAQALGRALMTMVRVVTNFGSEILHNRECERLIGVLRKMDFEPRSTPIERLNREQAALICAKAHEARLPSAALAQAFLIELELSQREVIGEWVPLSEPGESKLIHKELKWVTGLRWEDIDENYVLRYMRPNAELLEKNLNDAPMVMEEIRRLPYQPKTGPVIVFERSRLPYTASQFRRSIRAFRLELGIAREAAEKSSADEEGEPNDVELNFEKAGDLSDRRDTRH